MTQIEASNKASEFENIANEVPPDKLLEALRLQSALLRLHANDKKTSIDELLKFQAALAVQVDANELMIKRLIKKTREAEKKQNDSKPSNIYSTALGKLTIALSGATSLALPISLIAPTSITLPLLGAVAGFIAAVLFDQFAERDRKKVHLIIQKLEAIKKEAETKRDN